MDVVTDLTANPIMGEETHEIITEHENEPGIDTFIYEEVALPR
jgi:hypothetical protein